MSQYAASRMVLVGDDTAFVRDRFCAALSGAGHTAVPVATTAELLARVREEPASISLILLDLHMAPDGSVETVRSTRSASRAVLSDRSRDEAATSVEAVVIASAPSRITESSTVAYPPSRPEAAKMGTE